MSRFLILSMTPRPPAQASLTSWVNLGHIEILLWNPPAAPEAHGFCVAPTTNGRILRSVLWPQKARLQRTLGFPGYPSYWKLWPLSRAGAKAVADYVENLRDGCLKGEIRYSALFHNCFHVAYRCLELGGLDPPPAPRQLVVCIPSLGIRSFQRSVMRGVRKTVMSEALAPRRRSGSPTS